MHLGRRGAGFGWKVGNRPKKGSWCLSRPSCDPEGSLSNSGTLRPGTESPLVSRTSSQQLELSALIASPFCDRQDSAIPSHPAGEQRRILPVLARREKENRVVCLGKQCQRPGHPTLSISNAKANSCLGHSPVRASTGFETQAPSPGSGSSLWEQGWLGRGCCCHGLKPKGL